MESKFSVAAFDFDGTITYFDSLVPFLWTLSGKKTFVNLFLELPHLAKYLFGLASRQTFKERLLKRFILDKPISEIREMGRLYAQSMLPKLIKGKALRCIDWHKKQGHRLVLISANLDVYLEPWGKSVGFDEIICSKLEVNGMSRVTGHLLGKNCWGEEKIRRLIEVMGKKENYQLFAYGDSAGDEPLLKLSDYPFYRSFPDL